MAQIRTKYLESLTMDPNLMGTVELPPRVEVGPPMGPLLISLMTHPTRSTQIAMVGAIKKTRGTWAKVWMTVLTFKVPTPGAETINWTTSRGTGTTEVDRKRVRLGFPRRRG